MLFVFRLCFSVCFVFVCRCIGVLFSYTVLFLDDVFLCVLSLFVGVWVCCSLVLFVFRLCFSVCVVFVCRCIGVLFSCAVCF